MAVWGGLRNNCEKKRSEKQRRKGKIKHLNAEFQRITRRDKKALLSDQCKEIRGKQQNGEDQRSLQENQRYQGNISCKDGLDKGQKSMDLTEAGYAATT